MIISIDLQAKEWFDKVNGNSYFSAQVTIDFGLPTQKTVYVPFQYGNGDASEWESFRQLEMDGLLSGYKGESPSRFCRENNIKLNSSKKEKCLQREVKIWGSN